jgi:hypothetical protein
VGYEHLKQALVGLVTDSRTVDQTMGFIFSLAFHDFSVTTIFATMRGVNQDQIDTPVSEFVSRVGVIRQPGAIKVLWDLLPQLTEGNSAMQYGIYKLFELLSHLNHRNHAVLSSLGLVKPLFDLYYESKEDGMVTEKERQVWQKLIRRLLDMGANTADARFIFEKAITAEETLDAEVMDIIRGGMKSRWPEHFSMDSGAALIVNEDGVKGLPAAGFTFMVSIREL